MTGGCSTIGNLLLWVHALSKCKIERRRGQVAVFAAADQLGEAVGGVLDLEVGLDVGWRGGAGLDAGGTGRLVAFVEEVAGRVQLAKDRSVCVAFPVVGGDGHRIAVGAGQRSELIKKSSQERYNNNCQSIVQPLRRNNKRCKSDCAKVRFVG